MIMKRKLKMKNVPIILGTIMVGIIIIVAVFAPFIATHDPLEINIAEKLARSGKNHYLGADFWGRDIFSRFVFGARYSLLIGFASIGLSMIAGLIVGSMAGYYSNTKLSGLINWITDILMCFPTLILGAMVAMVFGPGIRNTILAISIAFFPRFVRFARATALAVKEELFITAARSIGMREIRLFIIHLIPNVVSPLIVMGIVWTSFAIIAEVGLSFLGLGVPAPTPSWGNIMLDNLRYFRMRPSLVIWPSVAIAWTIQGLNLIGDRFRDLLDPKMR
jgi:peptide/nickel transport system permease protein